MNSFTGNMIDINIIPAIHLEAYWAFYEVCLCHPQIVYLIYNHFWFPDFCIFPSIFPILIWRNKINFKNTCKNYTMKRYSWHEIWAKPARPRIEIKMELRVIQKLYFKSFYQILSEEEPQELFRNWLVFRVQSINSLYTLII